MANYSAMFQNISKEWMQILLHDDLRTDFLNAIRSIPETSYTSLCPKLVDCLHAFRVTSWKDLSVVIIGQDPYHTYEVIDDISRPVAHGLAFSSLENNIPGSLKVIYSALIQSKLIKVQPKTADLTMWAVQGVLLLNKELTCLKNQPNSHAGKWTAFTNKLIAKICEKKREENVKLIFMLWGKQAQSVEDHIEGHHKLYWIHPSPRNRSNPHISPEQQFVFCDHFTKVNELLQDKKIDWNPDSKVYFYTDGSASTKGQKRGGYSVYIDNGVYEDTVLYGPCDSTTQEPTNQRSEGMAFIKALQFILDNHIMHKIYFVTDSQFYISLLTDWMHKWYIKCFNFTKKTDGSPIKNRDIVCLLYTLYNKVKESRDIEFHHIYSHKKAPDDITSIEYRHWYGNYVADQYASKGKNEATDCIIKI